MNNLEIIKKEIHKYLVKNNWTGEYDRLWFHKENIICINHHYFAECEKRNEVFEKKHWYVDSNYYDKYLLEYIGHILIKYKITEIGVDGLNWKYKSDKWTYNTINRI